MNKTLDISDKKKTGNDLSSRSAPDVEFLIIKSNEKMHKEVSNILRMKTDSRRIAIFCLTVAELLTEKTKFTRI